ncbi:hypothetical protein KC727_00125 [Candidatus Kaiserbacteria bacterium]|nr:hypothetical protein [Candidatus Kaiserbacteria bacterium]
MTQNTLVRSATHTLWCLFVVGVLLSFATTAAAQGSGGYVPLAGIPGVTDQPDLVSYINALYMLTISVGGLYGVIKIAIAGIKWSVSDVVTDKSDAKKGVYGALLGLAILLSTYVVLNTINPQLTNLNIFGRATEIPPPAPVAGANLQPGQTCLNQACTGVTKDTSNFDFASGQRTESFSAADFGAGGTAPARTATFIENCKNWDGSRGSIKTTTTGGTISYTCTFEGSTPKTKTGS